MSGTVAKRVRDAGMQSVQCAQYSRQRGEEPRLDHVLTKDAKDASRTQDSRPTLSKRARAWGWWRSSATRCAKKALVSTKTRLTASSRNSPPDTRSCCSRCRQRPRAPCRHARAIAAWLPAGDPRSESDHDQHWPADPQPAVAAPPRKGGGPDRGFLPALVGHS